MTKKNRLKKINKNCVLLVCLYVSVLCKNRYTHILHEICLNAITKWSINRCYIKSIYSKKYIFFLKTYVLGINQHACKPKTRKKLHFHNNVLKNGMDQMTTNNLSIGFHTKTEICIYFFNRWLTKPDKYRTIPSNFVEYTNTFYINRLLCGPHMYRKVSAHLSIFIVLSSEIYWTEKCQATEIYQKVFSYSLVLLIKYVRFFTSIQIVSVYLAFFLSISLPLTRVHFGLFCCLLYPNDLKRSVNVMMCKAGNVRFMFLFIYLHQFEIIATGSYTVWIWFFVLICATFVFVINK